MTTALPEAAVVAILDSVTGLTKNTNLFEGPPRPGPTPGVFVAQYDVGNRWRQHGTTVDDLDHYVQVTVREVEGRYAAGAAVAEACRAALNWSSSTGYWRVIVDSGPQYLGLDEDRRHRWSINARLSEAV